MLNLRVARHGKLGALSSVYGFLALSGAVCALGFSALVEMVYHRQLDAAMGPVLRFLGLALDTSSALHWSGLLVYLGVAIASFEWTRRRFALQWNVQHQHMEDERLRAAMQP
jgi:branched-chain amino acid transport system permease protein